MATRFSQQFNRLGAPLLIRQFGESIVYYAGGTGAGRTIDAIIDREHSVVSDIGEVIGFVTLIQVRDSSTLGISAAEIDTGDDEVSVALRTGKDVQRRQIVRVVSTDNGMVQFEIN